MKKYSIEDIDDYMEKINKDQVKQLIEHCNDNGISPEICAWYDDYDDLLGDYVLHCDYSEDGVIAMLEDYPQMFCKFDNGEIVKLVW